MVGGMEESPPRAWAEIDISALRANYHYARECSGGSEVMAVVKANAYGHGYENVVRALSEMEPAFYGVANVREAREVRRVMPEARVYLLGIANPGEYEEIVRSDFTPCASCLSGLEAYGDLAVQMGKVQRVHIAVDTGMGRGGFLPGSTELEQALRYEHPGIQIEGVGSHLPVADEDEEFTQRQMAAFGQIGTGAERYRHISNSAGLMHYDGGRTNLVRPGLMLYGVSPLAEYQARLRPVMRLCSRVSIVRAVPAGQGVSYGRTYVTERDSLIATVGIGYADGLPRAVSGNGARVWINGEYAPIVGRVTMDQIMVDVTELAEVSAGDVVEVFGPNVPVTEVAEAAGTIPWEIFTGIAPRVMRVF